MGAHSVNPRDRKEGEIRAEAKKTCNHLAKLAIEITLIVGVMVIGRIGEQAVVFATTLEMPWVQHNTTSAEPQHK